MYTGAYSKRFTQLQQDQVDRLKKEILVEQPVSKTKKLSLETNRRRKALEIKKKAEAQKEEKRRQEILAKRRERQKDATERFQRSPATRARTGSFLHPTSPSPSPTVTHYAIRTPPALEEALRLVRGSQNHHRHNSYDSGVSSYSSSGRRATSNYGTSSRAYGTSGGTFDIQSGYYHSGRPDSYGLNSGNYTNVGNSSGSDRTQDSRVNTQKTQDRDKIQEHARAVHAELHNRSLRNLTSSRSLFEQQLEQQQQALIEHQQKSLHEFSSALLSELNGGVEKEDGLKRCDSLSSVDSLDEQQKHAGKPETSNQNSQPTDGKLFVTQPTGTRTVIVDMNNQHVGAKSDNDVMLEDANDSIPDSLEEINPHTLEITTRTAYNNHYRPVTKSAVRSYQNTANKFTVQNNARNGKATEATPVSQNTSVPVSVNNRVITTTSENSVPNMSSRIVTSQLSGADFRTQPTVVNSIANTTTSIQNAPSQPAFVHQRDLGINGSGFQYTDSANFVKEMQAERYRTSAFQIHNKAWGTPTPDSEMGHPSGQTEIPAQTIERSPLKAQAKISRPYSAKTTATAITTQYADSTGQANVVNNEPTENLSTAYTNQNVVHVIPTASKEDEIEDTHQNNNKTENNNDIKPKNNIQGILKRPSSDSNLSRMVYSKQQSSGGGTPIRDSVELTKEHIQQKKEKSKRRKGIRWADLKYEDESDSDSSDIPLEKTENKNIKQKPNSVAKNVTTPDKKPPTGRPVSARVTTTSTRATPPAKEPRVTSAGTTRQGGRVKPQPAFHPTGTTQRTIYNGTTDNAVNSKHAISYTNASDYSNEKPAQPVKTGSAPFVHGPDGDGHSEKGKNLEPKYDNNGLRLDRTPTDDEINWLWDKVRTCLNKEKTGGSDAGSHTSEQNKPPRPETHLSQKLINGTSLHFATNTNNPTSRPPPAQKVTKITSKNLVRHTAGLNNTFPRQRTSSDNTYNNRSALLQQRQQVNTGNQYKYPHGQPGNRQYIVYQSPVSSAQGPVTANGQINPEENVSESMAAFLAAENLANHQSVSEKEIYNAMDIAQQRQQAYNASRPAQKVPTALSIEEQRLMQSLERLNERLRITEAAAGVSDQPHHEGPNTMPSGFRGHQPMHKRTVSDTGSARNQRPNSGRRYRFY